MTPIDKEKYVTETSTGSYGSEQTYITEKIHNASGDKTIKPVWNLPANAYVTKVSAYNGYDKGTSKYSVWGQYGSTTKELKSAAVLPYYSGGKMGTGSYTFTDSNNTGLTAVEIHLYHSGGYNGSDNNLYAKIFYKVASTTTTSRWQPM